MNDQTSDSVSSTFAPIAAEPAAEPDATAVLTANAQGVIQGARPEIAHWLGCAHDALIGCALSEVFALNGAEQALRRRGWWQGRLLAAGGDAGGCFQATCAAILGPDGAYAGATLVLARLPEARELPTVEPGESWPAAIERADVTLASLLERTRTPFLLDRIGDLLGVPATIVDASGSCVLGSPLALVAWDALKGAQAELSGERSVERETGADLRVSKLEIMGSEQLGMRLGVLRVRWADRQIADVLIGPVREDRQRGARAAEPMAGLGAPGIAVGDLPDLPPGRFETVAELLGELVAELFALGSREQAKTQVIASNTEVARALRESEIRYREAQEIAHIGHWSLDVATMRFIWSSHETYRLLGLDQRLAHPDYPDFLAHAHPDDRALIDGAVERSIATGQPFRFTHRLLPPEGGLRYLEARGCARCNADGGVVTLTGTVMDVTERFLAEERTRTFETVFEATSDAILIADPGSLRLTFCNRAAYLMLGCRPDDEEMVGACLPDFWPPEERDALEAIVPIALRDGWTGDVRLRRLDASIFDASATFFAIPETQARPPQLVAVFRDISERKRIERDRRLTQFAVDRSADSVYFIDAEGRFLYTNDAVSQELGFTREALAGMSVSDIDPDIDAQGGYEMHFQRLRQDGRAILQARHRDSSGRVFPVEVLSNYLRLDGREYNCCFVRDITERRQAEDALKASRQWLGELINAVPDALFAIDAEGVVTVWNRAMEEMSGISREAVLGRGDRAYSRAFYGRLRPMLIDLVADPASLSDETRALYDEVQRDGDIVLAQVHIPSVYGGRGAHVWGKATPVRDLNGQIVGALEIIRDVTQQKDAEMALRMSEARFRSVISNAPVIIFELDEAGRFLLKEGRGLDALGLEPGALVGTPVHAFFDSETPVQGYLERALSDEPAQFTGRIGSRVFETFFNPMKAPGGDRLSVIGVAVDVTERTERELELQQRTDELTRFTYTVSHDLKSPLVTIRTFLGFLEQDLQKQNAERIDKDMDFIRNAAERMSRLLDELLELSRIGRMVNEPTEFSFQELTQEVLDLVAGRIVSRSVTVEVGELPVLIRGDRPRMVEVFLNLIDNAVKFMGDQPDPRVWIRADQGDGEIVFTIADNGAGIDPRHVHKIFGLFEKLDSGSDGTGIGLTLVQRIVEVHGGRIWAESEGLGKGTAFHFTLADAGIRDG